MTPEELTKKLVETEERCKANQYRIGRIEQRQDSLEKLVSTVEVLAVRQGTIESDVQEIKTDVKALTEKPGKKWELVAEKGLITTVAAIIGFILARFGL